MARNRSNSAAIVVLLALILGVLLVFLTVGGFVAVGMMREAEYQKDLKRIGQYDEEIGFRISSRPKGDLEHRAKTDELIGQRNVLVRKWKERNPELQEDTTLEEIDKFLGRD